MDETTPTTPTTPTSENAEFKTPDELSQLADQGQLTQADLQDELAKYAKAYAEEFQSSLTKASELDQRVEGVKEFFKNNAGMAAAQIAHLAIYGDKETVKLAASKFIIEQATKIDPESTQDEIANLLDSLSKQSA